MSPIFKGAQVGLTSVSALGLLLLQPALAGDFHTPEIHVPTPQIHVPTPEVYVPDVNIKTGGASGGQNKGNHKTRRDADLNKNLKSGKNADLNKSQKGDKDLPPKPPLGGNSGPIGETGYSTPGLSGVTLPGGIVEPPGVGNNAPVGVGTGPAGLYNPNCNGAADCGSVTGPVQPIGSINTNLPQLPQLAGEDCEEVSSGGGGGGKGGKDHLITITEEQITGNGTATITVNWQGSGGGGGGHDGLPGSITAQGNGTYSITFCWSEGSGSSASSGAPAGTSSTGCPGAGSANPGGGDYNEFTGTLTWVPGPNGTGYWELSGTVTIYNAQGQVQSVSSGGGSGPGSGSCAFANANLAN